MGLMETNLGMMDIETQNLIKTVVKTVNGGGANIRATMEGTKITGVLIRTTGTEEVGEKNG